MQAARTGAHIRDAGEGSRYTVVEGGTNVDICQGERPTGNCMPLMDDLDMETGGNRPGRTYESGRREFWWGG